MTGLVFVSAKGAPGVTTAAASVAAVASAGSGSLLVELDPAGGSVQTLTAGLAGTGLVEAAGALRRDPQKVEAVTANATTLVPGLHTVVAPTMGPAAESVVGSIGSRWLPVLSAAAPVVMVDGGRWSPSQPAARRIEGAGLVVVVCQPTLASVEHTRHLIQPLREVGRQMVVAVVVGYEPYLPEDVAQNLGVPLAGALPWDPAGVAGLWSRGAGRRWLRSRLGRSAVDVFQGLMALVANRQAEAPRTGGRG